MENGGGEAGLGWGGPASQEGDSKVFDVLIFLKQLFFTTWLSSHVEESLEGGKAGGQEVSEEIFIGKIQET